MKISREDWDPLVEKACNIANASDDDIMSDVHREQMFAMLNDLEAKYDPQSQILATRADYLDDIAERALLYERALNLAKASGDQREIDEITDSIKQLSEEN